MVFRFRAGRAFFFYGDCFPPLASRLENVLLRATRNPLAPHSDREATSFIKRTFNVRSRSDKVSIYARVSTDDKGQDPLNQILELRRFASRQGWTLVREYADEATAILRTTER